MERKGRDAGLMDGTQFGCMYPPQNPTAVLLGDSISGGHLSCEGSDPRNGSVPCERAGGRDGFFSSEESMPS